MAKNLFVLFINIVIISCSIQKPNSKNDTTLEIPVIDANNILAINSTSDPSQNMITNNYPSYFYDLLDITLLESMTKNELRILRNTIFARYGFIFSSEDLRNYFSQFPWYNPTRNNVEDELTQIDWKNIRLITRAEQDIPVMGVQEIEIIIPSYVTEVNLPNAITNFPRWPMKSQLNGRDIIYFSSYYLDISEMIFVNYFFPSHGFEFAIRNPFSNNIMPLVYDREIKAVNIITNNVISMEMSEQNAYGPLFTDSDRHFITGRIDTPEYTVAVISWYSMFSINKNHILIYEDGIHQNNRVINILITEFSGTAFDNNYILETIRNLMLSDGIVTKYDMTISDPEYFLDRMSYFFDNNLRRYLLSEQRFIPNLNELSNDPNLQWYRINIYENGFYIYDREKIILLDIQNFSITIYNYCEIIPNVTFQGGNTNEARFDVRIILHDNSNEAFIISDEHQYRESAPGAFYFRQSTNSTIYRIRL